VPLAAHRHRKKLLIVKSLASLPTLVLVTARAVNIIR